MTSSNNTLSEKIKHYINCQVNVREAGCVLETHHAIQVPVMRTLPMSWHCLGVTMCHHNPLTPSSEKEDYCCPDLLMEMRQLCCQDCTRKKKKERKKLDLFNLKVLSVIN